MLVVLRKCQRRPNVTANKTGDQDKRDLARDDEPLRPRQRGFSPGLTAARSPLIGAFGPEPKRAVAAQAPHVMPLFVHDAPCLVVVVVSGESVCLPSSRQPYPADTAGAVGL
jgi:hypothetical protein